MQPTTRAANATRRPAPTKRWNPHPTINERLSAPLSCSVKESQGEGKSKTSLRLIAARRAGAALPALSGRRRPVTAAKIAAEFRASRVHFCLSLSRQVVSMTYYPSFIRGRRKCRFCQALSLRISEKTPSLRDGPVKAAF